MLNKEPEKRAEEEGQRRMTDNRGEEESRRREMEKSGG